ncbi:MAG: hypothetical protein HYY92_01690 [Parcubacteria group bacterium]|nr:hypothetical protein [Parcubacteria group bacterium]
MEEDIFFTPKAYGMSVTPALTLEQAVSVGGLPYCEGYGFKEFRNGKKYYDVRVVIFSPETRKKVVSYLERKEWFEFAKAFQNAAGVVAVVWYPELLRRYSYKNSVYYSPVYKDETGRWCVKRGAPTIRPGDEIGRLFEEEHK